MNGRPMTDDDLCEQVQNELLNAYFDGANAKEGGDTSWEDDDGVMAWSAALRIIRLVRKQVHP